MWPYASVGVEWRPREQVESGQTIEMNGTCGAGKFTHMQRTCPECGGKGLRIVYGLPSLELAEAADRGEVVLGGCVVGDENPNRHCVQCSSEWSTRTLSP
jgi:hypothetical protein